MTDKKGKLVIISGPSGTGKGTVIKEIMAQRDDLVFSVSATTRKPRPGETHGVEYLFIPKDDFNKMISNDELLEHAEYVGEFYGTPAKQIIECIDKGKTILLDIEVKGAKQVMAKMPEAVTIFITAPDMNELERRLRGRGTDTEEKLQARLERARQEIPEKEHYKFTVINDSSKRAAAEILEIIDRKD